ncbi:MAG: response regulator, partial [Thermodesulfobacteriota bacterium]
MEKKILIVDDEDRVVKSITGVLEDEGFGVTAAKSGEEALDIFRQEEPLVTLLDIWMPGMDGIEVLKRIKEIAPDSQVVMLSGHATISMAMTAVKLGAFDFIEKPLSLDGLLMTIRRAITHQEDLSMTKRSAEINTREPLLSEIMASLEEANEDVAGHPLSSVRESVSPIKKTSKKKRASLSPQRTLRKSMVLYGTGLHSGMKTGLLLQPLPPNMGILFGNVSSDDLVPL